MNHRAVRGARAIFGMLVLSYMAGASQLARGEDIRLKDGTKVSATVLQKDGEHIIVQIARSAVESVDGRPLPPPVAAGTAAPEFAATDLAGAAHALAEQRGHVTLLQFWASWCPHCRSDLPYMKELAARHRKQGFRLVTVSVDQDAEELQRFIREQQLSYPIISSQAHPDLPDLYEMQGIPAYYLIDAKGVIAKTWSGSLTEGGGERKGEFEKALADLLKASGG